MIIKLNNGVFFSQKRCYVPNCDNSINPNYDEPWVHYAVPGETNSYGVFTPEQCKLFVQENATITGSHSLTTAFNECPPQMFTSNVEECDRWVYDPAERTIVEEVSMQYVWV